jgi:hypothetical protein
MECGQQRQPEVPAKLGKQSSREAELQCVRRQTNLCAEEQKRQYCLGVGRRPCWTVFGGRGRQRERMRSRMTERERVKGFPEAKAAPSGDRRVEGTTGWMMVEVEAEDVEPTTSVFR